MVKEEHGLEIDSHKLMYHRERVAEWKAGGDCFPIYVEIGTTNRCNHKCIYCALDKWVGKNVRDIDSEVMRKNLEDMAKHGVKSLMFAGEGESVLHKDIASFVKTAKENGIDVALTTNGGQYTPEKIEGTLPYLSWLRFSLDAGTAETHSYIHRVRKEEFDRIISHIEYAARLKKKEDYPVVIGIQALLLSKNANELLGLTKKAKELGADNIQIKPYSKHPLSESDLTVDYSRIRELKSQLEAIQDKNFEVKFREKTIERLHSKREYNVCHGLPFFSLIDARGNVIPCNLFYENSDFTYGNIHEKMFSEIWASKKRRQVFNKIYENGVQRCRMGCRLDPINRWLEDVKSGKVEIKEPEGQKPAHVNFI